MLGIDENFFQNYKDQDIVICCEGIEITYSQLCDKIEQVSNLIQEYGIFHTFRIGLILDNSVDFIVFLLSFLKNQNLICLLSTQDKAVSLQQKMKLADSDIIICEDYIKRKLTKSESSQVLVSKIDFLRNNLEVNFQFKKRNDVDTKNVLIQSSSGTSGDGKLAYRTKKNIEADIMNIIQSLKYKKADVVYVPVSLSHGYGLTMGLFAALRVGAKIIIEKWFMMNRFIDSCILYSPNIFLGTPGIYQLLSTSEVISRVKFENFKWIFSSGTALTYKIGLDFYKITHRWIHQVYGMMETSTISVNQKPNQENFLSVGCPVENVDVKIENNLIFVKGVSVSKVSVTDENLLSENTNWFCTYDYGYKNNDGCLFITKSHKKDLGVIMEQNK